MRLTGRFIDEPQQETITDLVNLLQQTPNLVSLLIGSQYTSRHSILTARMICAMTPSHVKHLSTSIKSLSEAKIILKRYPNLSTVHFVHHDKSSNSSSFLEWLEENMPNSSYYDGYNCTTIWLRYSDHQSTAVAKSNKRIKFANEHNT